jgi:hypothetical protein
VVRIEKGAKWCSFDFSSVPTSPVFIDNMDDVNFINQIQIINSNVYIPIANGIITLDNAEFKMEYMTLGMNEAISVIGQFVIILSNFLEDTDDFI